MLPSSRFWHSHIDSHQFQVGCLGRKIVLPSVIPYLDPEVLQGGFRVKALRWSDES